VREINKARWTESTRDPTGQSSFPNEPSARIEECTEIGLLARRSRGEGKENAPRTGRLKKQECNSGERARRPGEKKHYTKEQRKGKLDQTLSRVQSSDGAGTGIVHEPAE